MLVSELGVDRPDTCLPALEDGREEWRRQQARTVVRDAPRDAAETLVSLGYVVTPPPAGHPEDKLGRLRDL